MGLSVPLVSLSRRISFSAARQLFHPDWSEARNREVFGHSVGPHGHEYLVEVAYSGPISAEDGMIANLIDLKPLLNEAVASLHNRWLERDVADFTNLRPTAENVARFVWNRLPTRLGLGQLYRLRMRQSRVTGVEILSPRPRSTENQSSDRRPEIPLSPMMKVSTSYEFAAAHRLCLPMLSDQENLARFDKCANVAGHGHNYGLEVWIEGAPDEQTGFIINPSELDALVEEEVFERFDHKHLNEDCPEFSEVGLVPTSENLARLIFDLLGTRLRERGYHLCRIGLRETQKNYFEVEA